MLKKRLMIVTIIALVSFGVSGCIDLFAVPGIGVSPDGSQLYFLSPLDASGGESTDNLQLSVASFGGTATTIMEGFGAFAVNPATGAVIFSSGLQEGEIDQTFIMRYENNDARLFIGPEAFGDKNFLATQMKFSPDGSRLAMTGITLPLGADLDTLGDSEEFDPALLELFDSVVYLVDVESGALTLVSDPAAAWVNTLDWSPNGQFIAYNGWVDSNGDGLIATGGGFTAMMGGGGGDTSDISKIHIYDVAGGQTTVVESTGTAYAPAFVSNSQVAYAEIDTASLMFGGGGAIKVYDLNSGSSVDAYQSPGLILGIALSPDGSQVAWTQLGGTSTPMMSDTTEEQPETPNELYVADTAFSSPRLVKDLGSDFGFVDAPVWMPDGSGILVTSTNILATFIGTFTGAMGAMAEGFGADAESIQGMEEIPMQQIELVNAASGEASVVYTGVMINGNFVASVIGMVGSGDMTSMFDDMESIEP